MNSKEEEKIQRIANALRLAPISGTVSVLPDFFIDRFLEVSSFDELVSMIKKKGMEGGGGSIREGIRQREVKGGNAVNLAYALGTLQVRVNLLAIANSVAADTLASVIRKVPSVNLAIIEGEPGYTIAFEFKEGARKVNVMVSDPGDLSEFDGSTLNEGNWRMLRQSRLLCVVNWAAMKKGNALTERVFSFARECNIETFFDPADVLELSGKLPEFKRRILDERMIDYFSMNDNEARILAKVLAGHSLPLHYSESELEQTVEILSDLAGCRIDVHTHRMSTSALGRDVVSRKCHSVQQKIVTGAGDVWDSANIIGYLSGLKPEDRLDLSNAAAGLYVSRESAEPPNLNEVLAFLTKVVQS